LPVVRSTLFLLNIFLIKRVMRRENHLPRIKIRTAAAIFTEYSLSNCKRVSVIVLISNYGHSPENN
jgi:hypothetical protein